MSLRLKTILGIGLIEAILLIILITTVFNYMQNTNKESLENYVETTSTLFATAIKDALLSLDLSTLDNFIEEILKNEGVVYAKIFDGENNLLASGGDENELNKIFKIDENYSEVNDNIFNSQKKIEIESISYGKIELGISTKSIQSAFSEAKKLASIIALSEMFLVALFSYALGTYLTGQLKVLRNSARNISEGNLDHSINIRSNDEIGEVAKSFNKMIASLKKANKESNLYHEELDELNKSLEERVERRTQKIQEQKENLESAYTELKSTQKQLIQSEKMASIGQLAAGVAHEINNPVAFIKSNLKSLEKYISTYRQILDKQGLIIKDINKDINGELNKKIQMLEDFTKEEDIDFINEDIENLVNESIEGSSRVEEIVKGLKVYSRSSDDSMENHDINECLRSSLKMLNNELKYKCEVIVEEGDLPLHPIDKGKIIQVFTNLIINAAQAIDKKGVLTIKTNLCQNENNKNIVISISDNGKGISPENLSKLFDPFFTTKDVGEGTGLGLSISQGIIHDHNGTIEVESIVDAGTKFTINLPIN